MLQGALGASRVVAGMTQEEVQLKPKALSLSMQDIGVSKCLKLKVEKVHLLLSYILCTAD